MISTQTSWVAFLTAPWLPVPAMSQMWSSRDLNDAGIVVCEAIADLQAATSVASPGFAAVEELPAAAEDVELEAAVLVDGAAGALVELDEELLLEPQPATAMVPATTVKMQSFLIMCPPLIFWDGVINPSRRHGHSIRS